MAVSQGDQFDATVPIARLDGLVERLHPAESHSNEALAYELLRLSQAEVPHDKGTLQDSGTVQRGDTPGSFAVGYNMKYAARLHEHPEYRFQKGRKGKYLEDPLKANLEVFGKEWGMTLISKLIE